ncbi:hypothetical protein LTR66_016904 [Elasticomyces elasticus]|nr:hypothetical protein LTR66_016904 [Elasticomyces elasticus]
MTSQSLSGKVAIITGGTAGIGAATAKHPVSLGAKVTVTYGSNSAAAEKFVQELGAEHVTAIQADGGSIEGCEKLVKSVVEKHGKIDILIPNAGRLPMTDLEHFTEAEFEKTFALNVKGPLIVKDSTTQERSNTLMPSSCLRYNADTESQNFASTVTPPYLLYCATKGAIDQMTRCLAKDLAKKGINVNAVAPGPTGTDLFFEGKSEQVLNMIKSANPYNRIGEPDEVAGAFAFLCSPGGRWVNGQILKVNGGQFVG